MSQHDYVIDNQSAPAARSDINAVLQAIATTNSGASAPVNSFPNQLWFDTAANQLKKRNEAGTGWIVLGTVDDTGGTFTPNSLLTTAGIAPATLVLSTEGIGSNNNNTTIPTSAAVKAYADATAAAAAAGVTSATTANVLAATAGATGGAVGTYAWLRSSSTGQSVTVGNTVTGYIYSSFEIESTTGTVSMDSGGTAPGTWRAMGSGGGSSGQRVATLFLRIS